MRERDEKLVDIEVLVSKFGPEIEDLIRGMLKKGVLAEPKAGFVKDG